MAQPVAQQPSAAIRDMRADDWPAVSRIYGEGIAGANATFEQTVADWIVWDSSHLPFCRLAAHRDDEIIGWAALSPASKRSVYRGVAEVSVYIATNAQGMGIGGKLLDELIRRSESEGMWTLQGSIFPENIASLRLFESRGFRRVGFREKIGQMNGNWRDTVLVERRSKLL